MPRVWPRGSGRLRRATPFLGYALTLILYVFAQGFHHISTTSHATARSAASKALHLIPGTLVDGTLFSVHSETQILESHRTRYGPAWHSTLSCQTRSSTCPAPTPPLSGLGADQSAPNKATKRSQHRTPSPWRSSPWEQHEPHHEHHTHTQRPPDSDAAARPTAEPKTAPDGGPGHVKSTAASSATTPTAAAAAATAATTAAPCVICQCLSAAQTAAAAATESAATSAAAAPAPKATALNMPSERPTSSHRLGRRVVNRNGKSNKNKTDYTRFLLPTLTAP